MRKYRNIIEDIVENKYDKLINDFDVCRCNICRSNVIAYTLNKFKPKYVVTEKAYLFTKVLLDNNEFNLEITKAVVNGIKIVSLNPHHD